MSLAVIRMSLCQEPRVQFHASLHMWDFLRTTWQWDSVSSQCCSFPLASLRQCCTLTTHSSNPKTK